MLMYLLREWLLIRVNLPHILSSVSFGSRNCSGSRSHDLTSSLAQEEPPMLIQLVCHVLWCWVSCGG